MSSGSNQARPPTDQSHGQGLWSLMGHGLWLKLAHGCGAYGGHPTCVTSWMQTCSLSVWDKQWLPPLPPCVFSWNFKEPCDFCDCLHPSMLRLNLANSVEVIGEDVLRDGKKPLTLQASVNQVKQPHLWVIYSSTIIFTYNKNAQIHDCHPQDTLVAVKKYSIVSRSLKLWSSSNTSVNFSFMGEKPRSPIMFPGQYLSSVITMVLPGTWDLNDKCNCQQFAFLVPNHLSTKYKT